MTLSLRNHMLAIAAAVLCAFITVGASVAPAIAINPSVAVA
jgi:hypothetical protein